MDCLFLGSGVHICHEGSGVGDSGVDFCRLISEIDICRFGSVVTSVIAICKRGRMRTRRNGEEEEEHEEHEEEEEEEDKYFLRRENRSRVHPPAPPNK